MADETTAQTALASPNGAQSKCVAPAAGLLERAIRCLTTPGADCEVPANEPCYLRRPENIATVMVALELLAMMWQWPGGAERLEEMRARWQADPEGSAAALRELIAQPVSTSPETDTRLLPGFYL